MHTSRCLVSPCQGYSVEVNLRETAQRVEGLPMFDTTTWRLLRLTVSQKRTRQKGSLRMLRQLSEIRPDTSF